MPDTSASVHVTKLAAAQRQLRSAIRMFFLQEDELAVHTVAAASYNLISDLKAGRRLDEAADHYKISIFYAVRDFHRGTLPRYMADNPESMSWIGKMAKQLPITADSAYSDFEVSVDEHTARNYWRKRKSVANFLKHAKRDPRTTLDVDGVNNLILLMQAVGAYGDLIQDTLDPEGLVLWLYNMVIHGMPEDIQEHFKEMTEDLRTIEPNLRKRFCYEWIHRLNEPS